MLKTETLSKKHLNAVYDIEAYSIICPWSYSQIEKCVGDKNFIVLTDGDFVLGYGSFYMTADEANINNIAVKKEERGKGYSKIIMEKIIVLAKEQGARAVTLEVESKNRIALNLYRSFGFDAEGERKNYYRDGDSAIIMWKRSL